MCHMPDVLVWLAMGAQKCQSVACDGSLLVLEKFFSASLRDRYNEALFMLQQHRRPMPIKPCLSCMLTYKPMHVHLITASLLSVGVLLRPQRH